MQSQHGEHYQISWWQVLDQFVSSLGESPSFLLDWSYRPIRREYVILWKVELVLSCLLISPRPPLPLQLVRIPYASRKLCVQGEVRLIWQFLVNYLSVASTGLGFLPTSLSSRGEGSSLSPRLVGISLLITGSGVDYFMFSGSKSLSSKIVRSVFLYNLLD